MYSGNLLLIDIYNLKCVSKIKASIHFGSTSMYHKQEIFGGGKYWRICGNSPNFYPPNVLVLPYPHIQLSSPIFYHPKVKEMCIRQNFTPPNISCIRYLL